MGDDIEKFIHLRDTPRNYRDTAKDKLVVVNDTADGLKFSDKGVDDFATAEQGELADSALQNVVEDVTPELGGDLDAQNNKITNVSELTVGGYSLPTVDGQPGQVMKTDGAGISTWEDDDSGASDNNLNVCQITGENINFDGVGPPLLEITQDLNRISVDPNSWWDAVNFKFLPTKAGYYSVQFSVSFNGTSNFFTNFISKNGFTVTESVSLAVINAKSTTISHSAIIYFNGTSDFITIVGSSAGTVNLALPTLIVSRI